jgi:hypothetical protein
VRNCIWCDAITLTTITTIIMPSQVKSRSFPKPASLSLSRPKANIRSKHVNSLPTNTKRHSKPAASSSVEQDTGDVLQSQLSPSATRDEACLAISDDEDEPNAEPTSIRPDLFTSALELPVFDSESRSVPFRHLVTNDSAAIESSPVTSSPPSNSTVYKYTLIIFVRNFFCSNSQQYLRALLPALSTTDSESDLLQKHRTRLLLIGHGHPSLIPVFIHELLSLPPGTVVATDPQKALFSAAGLGRTRSAGSHRPNYVEHGALQNGLRMATRMIQHAGKGGITMAFSGGDYAQNGGEFLVRNNEEVEVLWGHRMRNTRDHADVGKIVDVIEKLALDEVS